MKNNILDFQINLPRLVIEWLTKFIQYKLILVENLGGQLELKRAKTVLSAK